MGLLSSLPPHRRGGGWQWSFLDVIWAVFLVAVVVFLALVFTSRRGDPLSVARPGGAAAVPPCAAAEVDLLPCEDPRRSSRLSREMNYYRERHCPARGEAPACLVPPPSGYRVPVPWPESLHKVHAVGNGLSTLGSQNLSLVNFSTFFSIGQCQWRVRVLMLL
jgi:hypothetical protein